MKLHLGCGKRYIPGYIHIDAIDYQHIDHCASIDALPFIESGSIDTIYTCHVLEHFKRREVDRVLREWNRVLRPGGLMRISVPDFEKICEIYHKYRDINIILGPLFGRGDYLYNIHYNAFDLNSLRQALEETGFENVRRYDWRQTEHSEIDDFRKHTFPTWTKKTAFC